MLFSILTPAQQRQFEQHQAVDLGYGVPGVARFRCNMYLQRGTIAAVFRRVPFEIQDVSTLNLPDVIETFTDYPAGLVLVTGPTGSGKSTSLAALLRKISKTRACHVVTIEDPIEFLFTDEKATISQREIGTDTPSFREALRNSVRQDPDVIMVGEMRDLETVDTSLKAAETGHLVFSTIHTSDVASTINRLVSFFPTEEQLNVRARLADNVRAIVSLRLLTNKKETGRVPALEVLRNTRSIQECIRDPAKTAEMSDFIARGRAEKMQTFDQHLLDLLVANKISVETALAAASNPTDFQTKLSLEGHSPDEESSGDKPLEPFELDSDGRF